jgi:predicted Zn-dependent protease
MHDAFLALSDALFRLCRGPESLLLSLSGERTTFVSFNRSRIRQAGHVERVLLNLRLIDRARHAAWQIALSGDHGIDLAEGARALEGLRGLLPGLPPDPFLSLPAQRTDSKLETASSLPLVEAIVSDFLRAGQGKDVVGMLSIGTILAGFASSAGQRNWFERPSFLLDWSVHAPGRAATKHTLAGFQWDPAAPERHMHRMAGLETVLERPDRALAPGRYRAYLEPAAVRDLLELASKDGFSARAWRKGTGCFTRALRGEALSEAVTWSEDTDQGAGPAFDSWGFIKPSQIPLFENGSPRQPLVSPRSALEFGLPCTGAGDWEQPESLVMSAGELPAADALRVLGTGIWISHLHYLNPSDFAAGRFTGATRFATFWVQDGEPAAPVPAARLDESFLRIFGSQLEGLTQERASFLDAGTINGRSTRFFRVPGAIVRELSFV